jgi:transcriptional regulator with XRE-family HTH domain
MTVQLIEHFRSEIRAELARREWTQADLATALGVSQPTVSRIMAADDHPLVILDAIAGALDMQWTGINGLRLERQSTGGVTHPA